MKDKGAIPFDKGTLPWSNPGIEPHEKAIPETSGENASNPAAAHETSKGQPFGAGGSGYTKSS